MYSVTEALAWTISGATSLLGEVAGGDFNGGGGCETGDGVEDEEKEEDVDAEDPGRRGYKDAGSSIATF